MVRHNWKFDEIEALFDEPFNDLIFKSHTVHRQNFNPNQVQLSTLLSIKTGSCPEDCKYCPQSAHYNTTLQKEPLMDKQQILEKAMMAKEAGASRFCMGAAWRKLHDRDTENMCDIVKEVKALGLETCVTLGMVNKDQAIKLKEAGLDYYNHNIDSSRQFYKKIITTRTYDDRLETLNNIRSAGINVCCGGIIGMGEELKDRIEMLITLANLNPHPESVPINKLVPVEGTPLYTNEKNIDDFDFIKTIAIARIMMPKSFIRLSAGRSTMNEQSQALCFFAGANSIFYGEKLLTTENNAQDKDMELFDKLSIVPASID